MIRSMSRFLAAGPAVLLLAGCNVVTSEKPWFTASAADPHLAPGLWVMLQSSACEFESGATLDKWPDCAKPFFVRGGQVLSPPDSKSGEPPVPLEVLADLAKWKSTVPVLADGDPMVWQLHPDVVATDGEGHPLAPAEGAAPPFPGMAGMAYLYIALRPVARDTDGTLRSIRLWPVFCGPPPPKSKSETGASGAAGSIEDMAAQMVTRQPFPGLIRGKMGCTAASVAALRGAAALSEGVAAANGMAPIAGHWLRAGVTP
jgi:hypothetical protein